MSAMIQIRNLPDDVHRTLKARAAMAGMSLSDYLLQEVRKIASRPTIEELRERVRSREAVSLKTPVVDMVRAERDGR